MVSWMTGEYITVLSQETRRKGSEAPVSKSALGKPTHFRTLTTRCRSLGLRCTTIVAILGCWGRSVLRSVSSKFRDLERKVTFTFPQRLPMMYCFSFSVNFLIFPWNTEMSSTDRRFSKHRPKMADSSLGFILSIFCKAGLSITICDGLPECTTTRKYAFIKWILVPLKPNLPQLPQKKTPGSGFQFTVEEVEPLPVNCLCPGKDFRSFGMMKVSLFFSRLSLL
mmetsp:Transcript_6632/g.20640  ORF Transcript_6632/g.20640 Transcript_6632/m.20640 type:complete len:224 (-) Transcript_6632:599-1270(-)